tara:strand:- start:837109 stop:837489 length:381 start_codon:yes stop_codon:yes gene_type:complete
MLREAIDQAKSGWRGCNWHTDFGPRSIDLRGLKSWQAILASKATRGDESKRWHEAAQWLAEVERAANQAADIAEKAFSAAESRDFAAAIRMLGDASSLELKFVGSGEYERARQLCERMTTDQTICS